MATADPEAMSPLVRRAAMLVATITRSKSHQGGLMVLAPCQEAQPR